MKFKMKSKRLPQEVVEQIIFKLPIKSLVRFSSVSKEWYKTVTTFKPQGNKSLFLLDFSHTRNVHDVLCLNSDGTLEEYAMHAWNEENTKNPSIECYGNGLICFSDDEKRVTLWNPSVRRSLLLPKSDVNSMAYKRYAFGIVVDRVTNDYKILRTGNYFVRTNKVEIFRLSTGSWEVLNCETPSRALAYCQVDVKGISYWVGVDFEDNLILVSFDGHEESFGSVKIRVPGVSDSRYWLERLMYLFLVKESLVFIHSIDIEDDDSSVVRDVENRQFSLKESVIFIHSANNEDYDVDSGRTFFSGKGLFMSSYKIWKMDDYEGKSVNLWCTITFYAGARARPLGFRENGQLLWFVEGSKLISTDLEKGSHTCLGVKSADCVYSCPNYIESMALWKGPKFQTRRQLRSNAPGKPSFFR